MTLYLHGVTSCLISPLEAPADWKSDVVGDFALLKATLLSPLWYGNAAAAWGNVDDAGHRDERGRWAEIMYKTAAHRLVPLTDHELRNLKV